VSALDFSPDKKNHTHRSASQECEVIFGYKAKEYLGHSIYEFLHQDDITSLAGMHAKTLGVEQAAPLTRVTVRVCFSF